MKELAPLVYVGLFVCSSINSLGSCAILLFGQGCSVDELQDERASGDNTRSSGQKVPANYVFQDRTLSA
jgi:hypothetical protein